jgi:hypothetical protein
LGTQVLTLVKIPISEIEEWIRKKYVLPPTLVEFKIEDNNLLLQFSQSENSQEVPKTEQSIQVARVSIPQSQRKRAHRKRNRMKTRGWAVLARITNSKGQKCTIYEPFAKALQDTSLSREEQRNKVEEILRANRNKPYEESIQYFLENTLDYLRSLR